MRPATGSCWGWWTAGSTFHLLCGEPAPLLCWSGSAARLSWHTDEWLVSYCAWPKGCTLHPQWFLHQECIHALSSSEKSLHQQQFSSVRRQRRNTEAGTEVLSITHSSWSFSGQSLWRRFERPYVATTPSTKETGTSLWTLTQVHSGSLWPNMVRCKTETPISVGGAWAWPHPPRIARSRGTEAQHPSPMSTPAHLDIAVGWSSSSRAELRKHTWGSRAADTSISWTKLCSDIFSKTVCQVAGGSLFLRSLTRSDNGIHHALSKSQQIYTQNIQRASPLDMHKIEVILQNGLQCALEWLKCFCTCLKNLTHEYSLRLQSFQIKTKCQQIFKKTHIQQTINLFELNINVWIQLNVS